MPELVPSRAHYQERRLLRDIPSWSPHGYGQSAQPMGARNTRPAFPRSRGCSVVPFYNEARTHLALDKDAPLCRPARSTGGLSEPSPATCLLPRMAWLRTVLLRGGRQAPFNRARPILMSAL